MLGRITGASTYATSAAAVSPAQTSVKQSTTRKHGDFVPVYVAVGMIVLSVSLGLHTAKQQILHSPAVSVKKSRRETVPEVVEPDRVVEESKKFLNKSLFRRIAQVQEFDTGETVIPDPVRKEVRSALKNPRAETLKSVGIDPSPP